MRTHASKLAPYAGKFIWVPSAGAWSIGVRDDRRQPVPPSHLFDEATLRVHAADAMLPVARTREVADQFQIFPVQVGLPVVVQGRRLLRILCGHYNSYRGRPVTWECFESKLS